MNRKEELLDLDNPLGRGSMVELEYLKDAINTLEVKEVDLVECKSEIILEGSNFNKSWYSHPELAFKAGAEWMYNELMKGLCFETKVYLESDGCAEDFNESEWLDLENTEITELPVDALRLKAGDKVKIIIVKEDINKEIKL